jgi:hypothetical protein
MATVTFIASSLGFGPSWSGTVNLGQGFSAAVAQVALNCTGTDPALCEVYLMDYSINGNPVSLPNSPGVQGITGAVDSFSWAGGSSPNGSGSGWITIYCFQ